MIRDENSFILTGKFLGIVSEEKTKNDTYYVYFEIASQNIFGRSIKINYLKIKAFNGLAEWLKQTTQNNETKEIKLKVRGTILNYKNEHQLIATKITEL